MRTTLSTRLRRRLSSAARRALPGAASRTRNVADYRYVFIVTYGRSGSTLLMGLLNTIPGYRISGENYNTLYRLYQADAAIARSLEKGGTGRRHLAPRSSWYGTPRIRADRFRRDLLTSFVANVLRPARGDRVLGFKEIRYTKADLPNLDGFLEFLRQNFPACRIVFNHRKVADAAKSAWWANNEQSQAKLEAADARLLAIPADEQHFHFFYDEIDESLDNIRELFAFLGEEMDEAKVRETLATRHAPRSETYTA